MRLKRLLQISLLKSAYFNLKCFGLKGLTFPVIVSRDCRLKLRGRVEVANYKFATITIGFGGSDGVVENRYSYFSVARGTSVIFAGRAGISAGNSVRVDAGTLLIGNNFSTNKNCFIACSKGVSIGDDVTFGWNINVRDNDGHVVINKISGGVSESAPVRVGNHVWVASFAHILKGTTIPDDSVVAYGSIVTKAFDGSNLLIGGVPAKVLKEDIDWKY